MTGTLRLFAIEWRRSVALWFFPLMALAGGWFSANLLLALDVALWPQTSAHIALALAVIGPVIGGVAAWAASRDRRRGIGDLLATTPLPAPRRDLAAWAGLALWGVLAYVAAGLYDVAVTLRNDPWGEVLVGPIVIGLLSVVASAAIGYLVGTLIPSRLVPPLVPIALFFSMGLLNSDWFNDDPYSYLSPWTIIEPFQIDNSNDVFYVSPPSHLLPMSLWLLGMTGLALAIVALRRQRTPARWAGCVLTVAAASVGAGLLMAAHEPPAYLRADFAGPWDERALAPYSLLCVERAIPVCVHPAYGPLLADYADQIDRLVEPLLGLPGAPVRAEQLPYGDGLDASGTLAVNPTFGTHGVEAPAVALVQAVDEPEPASIHYNLRPEQAVIATWLAQRVDDDAYEYWGLVGGPNVDRIQADVHGAVDRFAALDPTAQRAWLEAHYADLRAGRLDLDDLP